MCRILLFFIFCSIFNTESIKIGSFNIQVFGQNKVSKKDVLLILVKILSRYDLVVIQEIRDSKNTSFKQLVEELNKYTNGIYKSLLSEKLGRTKSKEQYGLIYKPHLIKIGKTITFPNDKNWFERPPMGVQVLGNTSAIPIFALIIVHLDPDSVYDEVNHLYTSVQNIMKIWQTQNILILGDMNADCGYLSRKKMKQIQLRKDTEFIWAIPDHHDTTVGKGDCAYDRIIIHGRKLKQSVKQGSVKAYHFPSDLQLDNKMAKQVSDHYPVEVEIL
ncbi:unnamed protein product [Heterobilharzia americana]|nr:unnamed protein product [Heterobilharzia americana]